MLEHAFGAWSASKRRSSKQVVEQRKRVDVGHDKVATNSSTWIKYSQGTFLDLNVLSHIPDSQEPTPAEVNALSAKELNELSSKDRENAYYDIHGIVENITDEANHKELLAERLAQFEDMLQKISHKPAYDVALTQSKEFCHNRKRRLMFLYSEHLDAKRAASRFARHFETKLELFGIEKLAKTITLNDLNARDKMFLCSGWIQFLPKLDRAGRLVVSVLPRYLADEGPYDGMARAIWYVMETTFASNPLGVISKGIVVVLYALDAPPPSDRSCVIYAGKTLHSLPLFVRGFHHCQNDFNPADVLVRLVIGQQIRIRCRSHQGSHLECQYALKTFGIPQELFPVSIDGELTNENHISWFQQQQHSEELQFLDSQDLDLMLDVPDLDHEIDFVLSESIKSPSVGPKPSEVIEKVTCSGKGSAADSAKCYDRLGPLDIPLGRGKGARNCRGYIWFHEILDEHQEEYEIATKFIKTSVAEKIVQIVHEAGGRFLRPGDEADTWVEVEDSIARNKVSHAFRSKRKK